MKVTILAPRGTDPRVRGLLSDLAEKLEASIAEFDQDGTVSLSGPGGEALAAAPSQAGEPIAASIDASWIRLLAQYAARRLAAPPAAEDLEPHLRVTRSLRRHGLGDSELIVAVDGAVVEATLGAFAPFLAVMTRPPNGSRDGQPLPGALALALEVAPLIAATDPETQSSLAAHGCGKVILSPLASSSEAAGEAIGVDCPSLDDLVRRVHQQPSLCQAIFSLQQKREELVYEAQVAEVYDEQYHAGICYQQMDEALAEVVAAAAAGSRRPRILDLGCGPGSLVPYLAKIPSAEIFGVDLSPEMVTVAQRRYPAVDFQVGDCEAIPADDDAFDVVLCSGVLHHLSSLERTFEEICRVLRPGGALVAREPNGDHFGHRHPPEAAIHLCLRHHLYTTLGRRVIEEPDSHQFHRALTAPDLVKALTPWFLVERLRTDLQVAYFYDAIRSADLYAPVERLEATLDNQPGSNLVVVARLADPRGCAPAVEDRLAEIAELQQVRPDHLEEAAAAIEWFAQRAPSTLPNQATLASDDWLAAQPAADATALVLAQDPERLEALAAQLPGQGRRELLELSQVAGARERSYDIVLVVVRDAAQEADLLAAWRRCRNYGRFYLEIAPGAELSGRTEELVEALVPTVAFTEAAAGGPAMRCLSVPMGYTIHDARLALLAVLAELPETDEVRQRLLDGLEESIRRSESMSRFSALRATLDGRTLRQVLDAL